MNGVELLNRRNRDEYPNNNDSVIVGLEPEVEYEEIESQERMEEEMIKHETSESNDFENENEIDNENGNGNELIQEIIENEEEPRQTSSRGRPKRTTKKAILVRRHILRKEKRRSGDSGEVRSSTRLKGILPATHISLVNLVTRLKCVKIRESTGGYPWSSVRCEEFGENSWTSIKRKRT